MGIQVLTREKHGYDGYRVLVQIGKVYHRRYLSTAGLRKAQIKAVEEQAKQLNAEWLERKNRYMIAAAKKTHGRATKGREFGLTGIQLSFSAKNGTASPYFRILVGHTKQKPHFRGVSILSRGLDLAWEQAIEIWADTKELSKSDIELILKRNKPTYSHFEHLAGSIFEYGHSINIDRWIDAGIA